MHVCKYLPRLSCVLCYIMCLIVVSACTALSNSASVWLLTLPCWTTCILCVYSIIVYCPAWQVLLIVLFAAFVCNCNKEHYYYYYYSQNLVPQFLDARPCNVFVVLRRVRNCMTIIIIIVRRHRTHEMQTIVVGISGVCQSPCHAVSLCRCGWTDRGPAWGGDSWGPKEHCIRRESLLSPRILCRLRQTTC